MERCVACGVCADLDRGTLTLALQRVKGALCVDSLRECDRERSLQLDVATTTAASIATSVATCCFWRRWPPLPPSVLTAPMHALQCLRCRFLGMPPAAACAAHTQDQ